MHPTFKPETLKGRENTWRPRLLWEVNIKVNSKETEYEGGLD
jgi:hypothetical protein